MLSLKGLTSTLLTNENLQQFYLEGEIIEQDQRGPKVIKLCNGDFLKIFRARRFFSGARFYSHAKRFYRNAQRLEALKIPTVSVKSLHHLSHAGHTAVIYQPLAGETIRQLIHNDSSRLSQFATELGTFLATLHNKGIHFHSLHSGNILLTPENNFGLIDISDMSIYPWSLMCATRIRSFIRLGKYHEEMALLGIKFWHALIQGYEQTSVHSKYCTQRIIAKIDYLNEKRR